MSVDITRQELYDLVWSMPMIHAAKKFDISDVMLGRICEERYVPRPPRGYWANLQSTSPRKKRFVKPPLPSLPEPELNFANLIGLEYRGREAARTDRFDPDDFNDPIRKPPEPVTESLDNFRKRMEIFFPELTSPELITVRHPIVQKVLDYDMTLVAMYKRERYFYDPPKYQDEKGKICLHLLNVFLHYFEALGFSVSMRGKKYFTFYADVFTSNREFLVFINEYNPSAFQRKRQGEKKRYTYCFRWEPSEVVSSGKMYYEFEELNVDAIKEIVMDLVVKKEKRYRESVIWEYERNVNARKRAIEHREFEIRRAAERKRRQLEILLASREKLMSEAVADMNHSDKIRELIEVMRAKAESAKRPVKGMKHWIGWATHHANTIDPRHMSLDSFEAWASKFKLKK